LLVIRDSQLRALDDLPRRNFEAQLVRHFARFYPREFASAGPAEADRLITTGLRRAANHGLLTADTATRFVHMMIILGWEFDSDPQLPWARTRLLDYSFPAPERMAALFQVTLDYLSEVVGENGGRIARAMLRIRKYDLFCPWNSRGDLFRGELLARLAYFYPEKAALQGDAVNQLFLERATSDAATHELTGTDGIGAYVSLAFMLGIGFATDPLYRWAGTALKASIGQPEAQRVVLLIDRALEHIDASLKGREDNDERQE
jgi:hypothetical protein